MGKVLRISEGLKVGSSVGQRIGRIDFTGALDLVVGCIEGPK
jgi:hypothetical protein